MGDISSCRLCKYPLLLAWTRTRNLLPTQSAKPQATDRGVFPRMPTVPKRINMWQLYLEKVKLFQGRESKKETKKRSSKPGSISFHRVYWPLLAAKHKPHRPSSKETITSGHFVNMIHIILNDFLQVQREYFPQI